MRPLLCLVACLAAVASDELDEIDPHVNPLYYTNMWAVKIPGGPEVAKRVAESRGFDYVDVLPMFDDHYFLQKSDHPANSDFPATEHTRSLLSHKDVHVAYQQHVLQREKRELHISTRQTSGSTTKGCYSWMTSPYVKMFNDPQFYLEWYILDYRKDPSEPRLDLNVIPCWLNNITGKGVNVVFVDDGVDFRNEDLYPNYNPKLSIDLVGKDLDPTPVYSATSGDDNSHGTRCAGEVAMVANNGKCGVGIAYNCNFGGIRLLDGAASDALEAQAMKYMCEINDVSSNSWGPSDNGKIMEAVGPLTLQAMEYCINKGRRGLGLLYVFACGNGKMYGDSCAADGFAQSIYTMAIASASQNGQCPFYSEECAAVIGTAYSSGTSRQEMVLTTDLRNGCCSKHAGTSAAAPMVSGIFALALEANNKITWRDAQYLAILTCEVAPLASNDGWKKNGANLWFNNKFGFGLFSAFDLVKKAMNWVNVPPKNICELSLNVGKIDLPVGKMTSIPFKTDGCAGTEDEVRYLEHVELITTISCNYRGAISLYIKSPSGTVSTIMPGRFGDSSTAGLRSWKVMSLHFWGENPIGQWVIQIYIEDIANAKVSTAQLTELTIRYHGPSDKPNCYTQGDRKYTKFTLPTKKKKRSLDYVEEIVLDEVKSF